MIPPTLKQGTLTRLIREEKEWEIEIPYNDKYYVLYVTAQSAWFPMTITKVKFQQSYKLNKREKLKILEEAKSYVKDNLINGNKT